MNPHIKALQGALGLTQDGIRGPVTTAEVLEAADNGRLQVTGGPLAAPAPISAPTGPWPQQGH